MRGRRCQGTVLWSVFRKLTTEPSQCHLDAHTAKLLYHEDLDRFNANTNISSRVYGQKFYFWKRQTDSHVWAVY